jgi:hypothetical protein
MGYLPGRSPTECTPGTSAEIAPTRITHPSTFHALVPARNLLRLPFKSYLTVSRPCSCFLTGEGGSTKATITTLAGPYTLNGDMVAADWTGLAGVASVECHSSTDCSDVSPVVHSGPVSITAFISSNILTVRAKFSASCCAGNAPDVFLGTVPLDCNGGLFVLKNQAVDSTDCACSDTGSAFGGEARVLITCATNPCPTNTM